MVGVGSGARITACRKHDKKLSSMHGNTIVQLIHSPMTMLFTVVKRLIIYLYML